MAFSRAITHPFVSAIADGADATLVRPSNWNAAHTQSVSGATSGGIPYFSSTTSEATSALLEQYGLIVGGGAGAAPYTDGTNLNYTTSSGPRLQVGSTGTSAGLIIGYSSTSGYGGIWASTLTPSPTNYALNTDGTTLYLQGGNTSFTSAGATIATKFVIASTAGAGPAITAGTATTDVAALSVTRTNNNAAVATGVKFAFTDTTSAAGFLPFQVLGGSAATTNLLSLGKAGVLTVGSNIVPSSNGGGSLGSAAVGFSALYLDYTNTATVGAVTINKPSGRVIMGAGGTTFTLTNSLITANSHIFLSADSAPGNVVAVQFYSVPAAGSCTINAVPAVTNQTNIDFFIANAD